MKKLILLIAPLLLLVACKKEYAVERSVVIDAPKDVVWNQIKYFENWQYWSPWYAKDSTMTFTFEGEDGTEGSSYSWDSEESGSGMMENRGMTEGETLNYHTHFYEPWESETDGFMTVAEVEGGTEVTWGFSGDLKFPMSLFMNMDKMVGPDFESGLSLLKEHSEAVAAATPTDVMVAPGEVFVSEMEAQKYVAIRETIGFAEMADFFGRAYGEIMAKEVVLANSYPSALYYTWDPENMTTEVAAAIPVDDLTINLDDNMEMIELPASKVVKVEYFGSYEGSEAAHMAIEQYMTDNNLEYSGPAIEIYVTDPMMEPDTSKWHTTIMYPIK